MSVIQSLTNITLTAFEVFYRTLHSCSRLEAKLHYTNQRIDTTIAAGLYPPPQNIERSGEDGNLSG